MTDLPSKTVSDVATPPPRPEGAERNGGDLTLPAQPRVTARAPHTPLTVKGLLDVVVLLVATPVLLLAGVPARAYLISAGAWIVLRAVGVVADRAALAIAPSPSEIGLRLAYLLGRLFALAIMVILLRDSGGRPAALTALLVILVAFTIELTLSAVYRPKRR